LSAGLTKAYEQIVFSLQSDRTGDPAREGRVPLVLASTI
jgi:hypothetical protein